MSVNTLTYGVYVCTMKYTRVCAHAQTQTRMRAQKCILCAQTHINIDYTLDVCAYECGYADG